MMKFRNLISEIPGGKYHSVLMTSFSVNLFYLDTQLVKGLSGKGINYVSIVVDSKCLTEQLEKFSSAFDTDKRVEYSVHGYKTNGAFHPKIQFYVGNNDVLVLLGSGNVTLSGHGRNLEGWSVICASSQDSPSYPIIRNIWEYMKNIYANLGDEGKDFVSTIEQNCSLLVQDYTDIAVEHVIEDKYTVRFFTNESGSIFSKVKAWTHGDTIQGLTVMVPFYDRQAMLVNQLNQLLSPQRINLILEDNFGSLPRKAYLPENVHIYRWSDVSHIEKATLQNYFHAKCFFIKGEHNSYILIGSANASVAAFGIDGVSATNAEACIGYKSTKIDYFEESGLVLGDEVYFEDIEEQPEQESTDSSSPLSVWIKEASYEYDSFKMHIYAQEYIKDAKVQFYNSLKQEIKTKSLLFDLPKGDSDIDGKFTDESKPLFVYLTDREGAVISNKQFVISSKSMIVNNPSRENRDYRRHCREIENGNFLNSSTFLFLEKLMTKNAGETGPKSVSLKNSVKTLDVDDGHVFQDFESYQKDDGESITGYNYYIKKTDNRIAFDELPSSIIRYITNSHKAKESSDIDQEETDDVKTSSGADIKYAEDVDAKSFLNHEKTKGKLRDMYSKYFELIPAIVDRKWTTNASCRDSLKQFMGALYVLNRVIGYRYKNIDDVENPDKEHTLMEIPFSTTHRYTATEQLYRVVSQYSVHLMHARYYKLGNKFEERKFKEENRNCMELCFALISICDWVNEGNEEYAAFINEMKATTLKNLMFVLDVNTQTVKPQDIYKMIERSIMSLPGFDKGSMLSLIATNLQLAVQDGNFIKFDEKLGYIYLLPHIPRGAFPLTMAFGYNKTRKNFSPDYLYIYESAKCLPINKKKD